MPTFPCPGKKWISIYSEKDFLIDAQRNCDLKKSVNRFNIHVQPQKIKCLEPRLESGLDVVWKKYQVFSAAELFLSRLQEQLQK